MVSSKTPVRIVLITSSDAVIKRWKIIATRLRFHLIILSPLCEDSAIADCDILVWHDTEAIGVVPKKLIQKQRPIWLLDTERASKFLPGGRPPSGFQQADYYLTEPFTVEELQFILAAWL